MKNVLIMPRAFDELNYWAAEDGRIVSKIFALVKDIQRDAFHGLGKPEPMRHKYQGFWSRRITRAHRLVYSVSDDQIVIVACRFHYDK